MLQQVTHIVITAVHKEEYAFVLRLDWVCGPTGCLFYLAFSQGMYKPRQAGRPDD
jgi:hypothetical protein